jgi:anti-sigma regulatory factor (Ser/Thr protein kinase)
MDGADRTKGNTSGGAFSRTLTPETCDYSVLRQQFGEWLEEKGAERPIVNDWNLILTELATNACEATPPGGTITCEATATKKRIELSVSNPTVGAPQVQAAPAFDPQSESGGGLFIVDAIVHGIEYDVGPRSVTIKCWTPFQRF